MKLKLDQVSKRFEGNLILDQLHLDLEKVHALVLIGPSGGGKSTLLRIIAGLETPDAGGVEINGERIEYNEAALLRHRRGIGTVFQAYNLFPHLTALQNITLPLEKVHGHSAVQARETAMQILTRLQLESHARKRPAELSGGQRQRIAIARAILADPCILLLDEATSALDSESERLVNEALERLMHGRTSLVIAHRLSTVRHADRILVFNRGRIVESGTHDELLEQAGTYRFLVETQLV